jgi:hypothetical protein
MASVKSGGISIFYDFYKFLKPYFLEGSSQKIQCFIYLIFHCYKLATHNSFCSSPERSSKVTVE